MARLKSTVPQSSLIPIRAKAHSRTLLCLAAYSFLYLLFLPPLHASSRLKTDLVYMKNGDVITCEIRSLEQGQLTIKQNYANIGCERRQLSACRMSSTLVSPIRLQHGGMRLTDSRPTVVLADDNLQVTQAACALLDSGYQVVKVVADGEEAVRAIQELKPDLAILDISMPGMDGIAVARQLRKTGCNTRVVFVTLIEDDDYMQEARRIGHGYVLKRRLSFDLLTALTSAREGLFFCSR